MVSNWKRRRSAKKLRPGDGRPLQRFRWWQLLSRSLFHLRLTDAQGERQTYSVDVRHFGDSDGEVRAHFFLNDTHHAQSKLPAMLEIPGGAIEVVVSTYGIRRCHFIGDNGVQRQLTPDPASGEGRRARLDRDNPGLSRAIGFASFAILAVALVLGLPQIIEQITNIDIVAENVGTFTSPIHLPGWLNITLLVASIIASMERALRLRYNWILDGGLFDGDD
ncbi:hypothetical protein [Humidisolicoccus flavus]|uniref:hypothetical protein n=1 Tax=Humidisolicoccus flavus TaxID=3111414 RepID=UPI00324438E2